MTFQPDNENLQISRFGYKWAEPDFSTRIKKERITFYPGCIAESSGDSYVNWYLEIELNKVSESSEYVSIAILPKGDVARAAEFSFSIIDNDDKERHRSASRRFEGSRVDFRNFVEMKELTKGKNNLLKDGSLKLLCVLYTDLPKKKDISTTSKSAFRLGDDYETLVDNQKFSDVKFVIDDEIIFAHKMILSMRSPVLAAMFEHDMEENRKNEVVITDISHEVFKCLLQYIYCGKVNENLAVDLLPAADKYQLDELKSTLEDILKPDLSVDNALDTYIMADFYGARELKTCAKIFIMKHAKEIAKRPEFENLADSDRNLLFEIVNTLCEEREECEETTDDSDGSPFTTDSDEGYV